ncbi:hypothetical protein [Nocardia suismassiliense]|uniref:hypothetical protein n=1 Tax=Nocardia suismassiliense TaxID=2077092 RepID=UPI000D1DD9ED|nr:hypothetical protein [Nocardia suismassiliense]
MNAERDPVATQLFLRRGRFHSQDPTFAAVRADAIDGEWASALRTINYLAGRSAAVRERSSPLSAADEVFVDDLDWNRRHIEALAKADNIPYRWINHARVWGAFGIRMAADELLPAPWIDHRARLARSIGADIERLTSIASACVVRAHRHGTDVLDEALSAAQLEPNMRAIWTSAARTAEAIGAEADECRQLWQVTPQRWRATVNLDLSADPAVFDRWWSVYTDPDIATHVTAFVENLPLYAELASPTGSQPGTGTGFGPPEPVVWLTDASQALESALDPNGAAAHARYDIVLEAVSDPATEWEPHSETDIEHDRPLPPSITDHGPDPWD